MKNIFKTNSLSITIGVIGLLIVITGFIFLQAGQAQAPDQPQGTDQQEAPLRTISVSGSGAASAAPDQALIVLGVQTNAESAVEALTQNSERMQALIAVFRDGGVQARDIQTQSIQLFPRLGESPAQGSEPPEVVGYTASNTVRVRVRNLDALGNLLDHAVQAGGNTIQSISFEVGDQTAVLEQAREAAMQDARRKAEQLSSLAEVSLGAVLTIHESGGIPPVPVPVGREVAEGVAAPIEPGAQELRVDVQVTWLLE